MSASPRPQAPGSATESVWFRLWALKPGGHSQDKPFLGLSSQFKQDAWVKVPASVDVGAAEEEPGRTGLGAGRAGRFNGAAGLLSRSPGKLPAVRLWENLSRADCQRHKI